MSMLLSIAQASEFASKHTQKKVSESNITYLLQYGRIDKVAGDNGETLIDSDQLLSYYKLSKGLKEVEWKQKLGEDVNWQLSFDTYTEAETTKHVHRLHPYKGKFIPQLAEYFMDAHTDAFKRDVYFHKGDIVLDPFCGSGTTLVEANELDMYAIGVDVSAFNAQIANSKIHRYDLAYIARLVNRITTLLEAFEANLNVAAFENELLEALNVFNTEYFPSPEFKKKCYAKEINEREYGREKEVAFKPIFFDIAQKHCISLSMPKTTFMNTWYFDAVEQEIFYVNSLLEKIDDLLVKELLQVILSRTIRSCRATTHSDLATLIEPVYTTYYCTKHKKICKPLFSILRWWKTYSKDTIARLKAFAAIRTDTIQHCFIGNSATLDVEGAIAGFSPELYQLYQAKRIKGVFCSPPYVGLIDYHEQHAYAYELFGFERKDELEIGSMAKGNNRNALEKYVEEIASVLRNCKRFFADDYEVFIVANDKHGLYHRIAELAGMRIVEQFRRPVLNRTEKDKGAYSETIFRLKEK